MKRYLALILSIVTVLVASTGCGSKVSKGTSTKEPEETKLDTSVTVEDLLSKDNMSTSADIKDFRGIIDLDLVFDIAVMAEDETSNMKADANLTTEYDGKVLHTVANVKTDMMGETSEDTSEMWCSAEDKTKYLGNEDTWYKTYDVTPEELLEELVGSINISSEDTTIDDATIDEIIKDFKLELDEKNDVYVVKYETGIEDLFSKIPTEDMDETTGGTDINAIIEALNLPEDFKIVCTFTFNADKTIKNMEITCTKAELDLSELVGAECKIALNEIKIAADYTAEVETLTIPEDVVEHAAEPEEDGFWTDQEDYEDSYDEESEDEDLEVEIELEEN